MVAAVGGAWEGVLQGQCAGGLLLMVLGRLACLVWAGHGSVRGSTKMCWWVMGIWQGVLGCLSCSVDATAVTGCVMFWDQVPWQGVQCDSMCSVQAAGLCLVQVA
jgi:hypothetical protein